MNQKIINKIQKLKKERNAVILVHNYQVGEVQDIGDYVGDSLGLAIEASKVKAPVIVFCGVHFMAETAAILNPDKTVVIPDPNAGCPMADMITAKALKELKAQNPGVLVVTYVNSTAEVKAESDICCTSANSIKIVESLKEDKLIFVPDKYLGAYTASKVPNKEFIFWPGYCPTHMRISLVDIQKARKEHPGAVVMVHPECTPEAIAAADKVFSTGGMVKFAKESREKDFIVGTETGMAYRLKKDNPKKNFYPVSNLAVCPNMKLNTLEKVLWVLEELNNQVTVPEDIRKKALKSIERMLSLSG